MNKLTVKTRILLILGIMFTIYGLLKIFVSQDLGIGLVMAFLGIVMLSLYGYFRTKKQ